LLKLKVPGFSEDEIKVSINDGIIKVEGKCERKDDTFASVNSFTESYTLPRNADLENINAELKNGILAISLSKKELKGKEVQVKLLK
jgi:HSP20 family protein